MDSDDDDFGGDLDDTVFIQAATQAEKEHTFQPSPRPLKRRKIDATNEKARPSPPRQQSRRVNRGPFVSEDEDEDEDDVDYAPTSDHRKRTSTASSDHGLSTRPTSASSAARRTTRLPSTRLHDDEDEDQPTRKEGAAEKRRNRIHVPTNNLDLIDVFFTQPSRDPSPPWKPRGAIWRKPTTDIGVHKPAASNVTKNMMLSGRQSAASMPISRASPAPKPASPGKLKNPPMLPTDNSASIQYDPTQELADLPSDAFASSPTSSPEKYDDAVLVPKRLTGVVVPHVGLRQTTLFGCDTVNRVIPQSQANKRYNFIVDQPPEPPTHHKLDAEAMKTWVYPDNLGELRDYQFNIVARGLFHNLLVALPTGLGKTFIAATIMLNWFRWTVDAHIVFVAPTKPLVAQQIDACYHICGIPRSSTTLLTGSVPPALRAEEWASKRVFFMTPQTLLNDLKHGYADPKKIVLLVVDEAHRATGAYAYVEVVSFLRRFNSSFRVLALTATPGADIEAVQKVIDGLDISRIEIRTENSLDIKRYVHQRKVEKHVFSNSDEMQLCMDLYKEALQPTVNKVAGLNAFYSNDPIDITPYGVTQARVRWMQEAGQRAPQGQKFMANAVFTVLASISQGMELLKFHGIGPFYTKMKEFKESQTKKKSKICDAICNSEAFKKLIGTLQTWTNNPNFVGHPKLEYLQQVVLEHFANADERHSAGGVPTQTRIMVFAHFRDSAEEIVRVLKNHQPMIRPRVFVGQAASKNTEGMNQKEQLDVIEKFKAGTFNTLVATSIGEEGLDIGEVDLIICYDSKASPIRMLQRMGRTGRKRQGKIIMLQMEGKEENDATKAKDSYERMQELIAEGKRFNFHDDISRRILPKDAQPVVERRLVEIPMENSQVDWLPEPKKKRGKVAKKPPKKFHMPDGVLTGFVTAGCMDEELVPKGRTKKPAVVHPSEEVFQLPPLETVLLDERASHDLEQRYQIVFEEEDGLIIGPLNLGAHGEHHRTLSKTHYLKQHGRATRCLAETFHRMHTMNDDRLDEWNSKRHTKWQEMPQNVVVSDTETKLVVSDDMWADDDPASQPLPKPKARPGPKPKPKTATSTATVPRERPRKDASSLKTPVRATANKVKNPSPKTPTWQKSGLADECDASSPPPTDPRMKIASQAETLGSDDTAGRDEPQDTQAYRLDSDLVSFIAEDDEDVELEAQLTSSLPDLDFDGIGKGTQALVKAAKPTTARKAEKIFSSEITDDDAVVSSDSDDEEGITSTSKPKSRLDAFILDSGSEDGIEEDGPVEPRMRTRRIIEDDEDDD